MALLTSYWVLDVSITLLSLFIPFYLYMNRNNKYWKQRGVMQSPPTPFIGNFADCLLLKKSPGMLMADLYNQSKGLPYFGFYVFNTPCLLIRDPKILKNILMRDFDNFCDRYVRANKTDRLGHVNMFTLKNPTWKLVRSMFSPFFTNTNMKKHFTIIHPVVEELDKRMEEMIDGSSGVIEVKEVCSDYTADVIHAVGFGRHANVLSGENLEIQQLGKTIFWPSLSRGFELMILFFLPHLSKITRSTFFGNRAVKTFRKTLWPMILERMHTKTNTSQHDAIQFLLDMKKKYQDDERLKGNFEFEGDDLLAQIVGFFAAGYETSSTALAYSLYELAQNMDMQERLRAEISDALHETDGEITLDMVNNLPYLNMIISETLRMYPPLPFLERDTLADYKIPDFDLVLEKGTPIYVPMYAIHHDEEYFPDPERYDPERFNETNRKNIQTCTYFPFGDGPRFCIGQKLGLVQSKLGLIAMIRKFEFTVCDKTSIPIEMDPRAFFIASKNGLYLNVRKLGD